MKPFIRFELRFSLLSKCSHFLEYIYIMRRAIFADDKVGQIYRALSHVAATGQCNKYEQRLAKAQILCKMQNSNLKRSQTRKSVQLWLRRRLKRELQLRHKCDDRWQMRASKLISTATGCALLESIGSTALRSMLCKTLVTPRFELLCRSQSTTGRGTSTKHSAESKLNLEAYLQLSNNTLPRRSSRRESFLQQNRTERKRIT